MASLTKFHFPHQISPLHLNHHTQSQPKPNTYQILNKPLRSRSIQASSSSSFLKTTVVTLTTTAALLSASFHLTTKPATASPPPPPPSTTATSLASEQESDLENHLLNNPNDVESLKSLMQIKFEAKNLNQALQILNRLIEIEPDNQEWLILKSQIQTYNGEFDSATKGFEEILTKDPFCAEAYHGLVMAYSDTESKLPELENRITEAIEKCKNMNKSKEFRELMLLIAQIKVIEGNPNEALRVYQELVKDEPKDFRPYLCQGLIYTLMKKKDEAEKQFEEFRRLVPENHPYKEYFDANVLNTSKLFAKSR